MARVREAARYLMNRKKVTISNTQVVVDKKGNASMYLFGNKIAVFSAEGILYISNAGWFSVTTKSRLNDLPGVHISQRKGYWYLYDDLWNGRWIGLKPTITGNTDSYIIIKQYPPE
jgi:hypothetical protein